MIDNETLSPETHLKLVRYKLQALMLLGLYTVTFGLAIHVGSKQPLLPKYNKELGL